MYRRENESPGRQSATGAPRPDSYPDHLRHGSAEADQALASFDPVWETLSTREQARLLQLLIERVDYDGRDGTISITFHPSGIKARADRDVSGDAA